MDKATDYESVHHGGSSPSKSTNRTPKVKFLGTSQLQRLAMTWGLNKLYELFKLFQSLGKSGRSRYPRKVEDPRSNRG